MVCKWNIANLETNVANVQRKCSMAWSMEEAGPSRRFPGSTGVAAMPWSRSRKSMSKTTTWLVNSTCPKLLSPAQTPAAPAFAAIHHQNLLAGYTWPCSCSHCFSFQSLLCYLNTAGCYQISSVTVLCSRPPTTQCSFHLFGVYSNYALSKRVMNPLLTSCKIPKLWLLVLSLCSSAPTPSLLFTPTVPVSHQHCSSLSAFSDQQQHTSYCCLTATRSTLPTA